MNRRKVVIHLVGHHSFNVENAFNEVQKAYMPFWYLEPTFVEDDINTGLVTYMTSERGNEQRGLPTSIMQSDYWNVVHAYSIPAIRQQDANAKGWYNPMSWTIQNFASNRQRWINVMTHEFSHHFSRIKGIEDRTHEYHPNADADFQAMQDGIDGYLFKDMPREALVIHHSGVKKGRGETIEGIENHNRREYGRVWYHTIIGEDEVREYDSARHNRGDFHTTDVMVMGDYRSDTLSTNDYWRLHNEVTKHRTVVTHKELADMGYTRPTVCPGGLLEQYLNNRDNLVPQYVKLLQRYAKLLERAVRSNRPI